MTSSPVLDAPCPIPEPWMAPGDSPVALLEPEPLNLGALVEAAQNGDPEATRRLLEELRPYIERLARGYSTPGHACETTSDLVQEAWLRAWLRLDQFEGGASNEETLPKFRAWVGQLVHRVGLNHVRDQQAKRRRPEGRSIIPLDRGDRGVSSSSSGRGHVFVPAAASPTASAVAVADEETRRVQEALADLPSELDREIIRLRFFEGHSLREAAARLSRSYDTVRDRYRAALERLERKLGAPDEAE
jgi:RNA polymerase sigma factor (sigma-70 family)